MGTKKFFWAENFFFRHSNLILGQCDEPFKNEVFDMGTKNFFVAEKLLANPAMMSIARVLHAI
jgi:hypothetical protein